MNRLTAFLCACALAGAVAAEEAAKVAVTFELPPPVSTGTPKDIKSANLEPDPGVGKRRAPIMVPVGYTNKLTSDKTKVTTSEEAVIGENDYIVDGDKEYDQTCLLQLPAGLQWVQLDLGAPHEIAAVCVWHDQGDDRVYRDVVVQLSNDPAFVDGVQTIFNNDHDNTAKLGVGKDKEYRERNEGRPMAGRLVKARYVRCYSAGSTSEPVNNYIEVEVFGK